jgi:N-acylneuraminate cytidylyltransferase
VNHDFLAVVPARGGSTGLPGKNVRPFAGLPLIAHTLLMARRVPEIDRCVVSTDSPEIAQVARDHGGDVPFLRPAELARTETPIWPVLQHALAEVERQEGRPYGHLMLIDPTSPARLPEQISEAYARLRARPDADGIIAVSKPDFNPIWVCVTERDGWMKDLFDTAARFQCRQEVPEAFRINGTFYLWRTDFVRTRSSWRENAKLLMYETSESRAFAIDTLDQFERAEALVKAGLVPLPWLESGRAAR